MSSNNKHKMTRTAVDSSALSSPALFLCLFSFFSLSRVSLCFFSLMTLLVSRCAALLSRYLAVSCCSFNDFSLPIFLSAVSSRLLSLALTSMFPSVFLFSPSSHRSFTFHLSRLLIFLQLVASFRLFLCLILSISLFLLPFLSVLFCLFLPRCGPLCPNAHL